MTETAKEPPRIRIERMLPLYEGKMLHHFDHRWATHDGESTMKGLPDSRDARSDEKQDPAFSILPRYWVADPEVQRVLGERWSAGWLMGWRKIARATDERTTIAFTFPRGGLSDSANALIGDRDLWPLAAALASLPLDFVARQKVGGSNFNFFQFSQLATPSRQLIEDSAPWVPGQRVQERLRPLVLELTYTAWDMAPFAEDLGDVDASGRVNPPFVWDDERRFWLRVELDAAFFHLYGIVRDDVDYIMDTFPIVRRKDEARHGEYRTKRVILELFDLMQAAVETGVPYASPIDPPPGHGPRHPARKEMT